MANSENNHIRKYSGRLDMPYENRTNISGEVESLEQLLL